MTNLSNTSTPVRWHGIDRTRGALLVLMLLVHLVSRYATAEQGAAFAGRFGIFLVSAGFVALSGYVAAGGARSRRTSSGVEPSLHLLLVMYTYGVIISLVRHALQLSGGGPAACSTQFGWTPPTRFEDLGILLPIAIVALLAPLARGQGRWVGPAVAAAALLSMLLPGLAAIVSLDTTRSILGILVSRTLTPFYTVSTFVAVGLLWALLGRWRWHVVLEGAATPMRSIAALVAAFVLAAPTTSASVLDPLYSFGGAVLGGAATLVYWTAAISALLYAFSAPVRRTSILGRAADLLGLLGRHSLLVFVAHGVLLEIVGFVLTVTGAGKGLVAVGSLGMASLALLLALAHGVESRPGLRWVARVLLLDRSRVVQGPRGPFSGPGMVALAFSISAYLGASSLHSDEALVVDDMERGDDCPTWWTFGELQWTRIRTPEGDHVLEARGAAPGMYAHGAGLFFDRELGARRSLHLDVWGQGPESGRLKLELAEDDNGNWEIEKDPRLFTPLYDDRFVHELQVDWTGWRHLVIPASALVDDNRGRGNDVFDPERDLTSGGLLEIQLLVAPASRRSDEVHLMIDDIRWLP